ncbi:MAG: D-alanine--D-alanine ligase [Desulfitobacteriaceae bacterium]|nr:D-alanine--D-alanine ligase [Desulfitobacteriaceae bacterium]
MNQKINIGILFGGKSAEHEVSIQSAKNVYDAINKNLYNVTTIGISKKGEWLLDESFAKGIIPAQVESPDNPEDCLALVPGGGEKLFVSVNGAKSVEKLDVIFPVLHGTFGEDGTVQGLLKLAGIPFVGAGVLGSAVGMDKDIMKRLLRDAQLPSARYFLLFKYPGNDENPSFKEISRELGLPLFVKPANMGSSVGISMAHNEDEFNRAISEAFKYDHKLIVEETIVGREIECSVLGNDDAKASLPGEVINLKGFYSYDAKYIDENASLLEIPAKLTPEEIAKIQQTAVKAFKTLCCEGFARVDVFLTDDGEVIVNEINTIPGFTKISMYPKMWEASGIPYQELIDRLIQLALEKFRRDQELKTSR